MILPFIVAKIDEASLALPCSVKWTLFIFKIQIRVKHSISPGLVIFLFNKTEPVERAFVSQNIFSFANGNDNIVDRLLFISRKYAGKMTSKSLYITTHKQTPSSEWFPRILSLDEHINIRNLQV